MITTTAPTDEAPSTRTLPRIFSKHPRCEQCRRTSEIRVHYCPGCAEVSSEHFHRHCPCGATWLERSAGHGGFADLDNPAFVLICQHCRSRIPKEKTQNPRCCRTPEISYHDLREPCEICG
jgi:hypothetical protein